MSESPAHFEKLKADLKVVGTDLTEVGRQLLDTLSETTEATVAKVQGVTKEFPGKAKETLSEGVTATRQKVKEKPLAALGLAAVAGALVAVAIKRK